MRSYSIYIHDPTLKMMFRAIFFLTISWADPLASARLSKRLAIMVHFLIVVSFAVALAAAGAIQCEYSPGGGIQWLPG